ncbi:MAG: thiamine biosynthesis protein ThiC [Pseudomonadota bacterium]
MEFTQSTTVKTVAVLLLLTAVTQPIYTALFLAAPDVSRQFLWGLEGLLFVLLAVFAGSALGMAKQYSLGFSAIAFSAVLNLIQVGVGFTQFGPFNAIAKTNTELGGIAFSIVAFAFFIYNAAKIMLGLAAVVFGVAINKEGKKILGSVTALTGAIAIVSNTIVMMVGIRGFFPSPIAGGSGVLATILIALCLFSIIKKDNQHS